MYLKTINLPGNLYLEHYKKHVNKTNDSIMRTFLLKGDEDGQSVSVVGTSSEIKVHDSTKLRLDFRTTVG